MSTRTRSDRARDAEALAALLERSRVGSSVSGERAIDIDARAARGTLVADRYRLGDQIGHGGMSRVYVARDLLTDRDVAIKVVSFANGNRAELEARFRREVELVMQLCGPVFVKVFDHAIRVDCAYLTMELLKGESLQSYLSREGRLDRHGTLDLLRGLCEPLTIAHSLCIVHRDLKPGNIFIVEGQGQGRRIRLIDFGIARDLWTSSTLTKTGAILGSPHYVSPEQALAEDIDHRTDLWALGVILFRCLTGTRPFDGKLPQLVLGIVKEKHPLPSKLVPALPSSVDAFFERALAKRPDNRFQNVREMLAAFEDVVAGWSSGAAGPLATVTPIRGIARTVRATPQDEQESEPTATAAETYASYAALVSTERISGFPTVEVASPLLAGSIPRPAAPDARAASLPEVSPVEAPSPWVSSKPRADSAQMPDSAPIRLPSRWWEVGIAAAVVCVLLVVVVWVLSHLS